MWPFAQPAKGSNCRKAEKRALRYNLLMSRLRRLQITGRIFFLTCNLLTTRTRLTEPDFEALANALIGVRNRRGFSLPGYVFMPDHWHAMLLPRRGDTLPQIMNALKVSSMRGINRLRNSRAPLWQPRYYDRIIRDVKEFHDTLRYLHLNPVQAGLARYPKDWPWSSFHAYGGPGPIPLKVDILDLPADEKTPL